MVKLYRKIVTVLIAAIFVMVYIPVTFAMVYIPVTFAAESKTISADFNTLNIRVKGKLMDAYNFVNRENNRTYVQLKNFCELLGMEVLFDAATNTVNVNDEEAYTGKGVPYIDPAAGNGEMKEFETGVKNINVEVNTVRIKINGENIEAESYLYNGVVYVQLLNLCSLLNKELIWDKDEGTAYVNNVKVHSNEVRGDIEKLYQNVGTRRAAIIKRLRYALDVDLIEVKWRGYDEITFYLFDEVDGIVALNINFNGLYSFYAQVYDYKYFDDGIADMIDAMALALGVTKNNNQNVDALIEATNDLAYTIEDNTGSIINDIKNANSCDYLDEYIILDELNPQTELMYNLSVDEGDYWWSISIAEPYDATIKQKKNKIHGDIDEYFEQIGLYEEYFVKNLIAGADVDDIYVSNDKDYKYISFEISDDKSTVTKSSGIQVGLNYPDDDCTIEMISVNSNEFNYEYKLFNRAILLAQDDYDPEYNQQLLANIDEVVKIINHVLSYNNKEIAGGSRTELTKTYADDEKYVIGDNMAAIISFCVKMDEGKLLKYVKIQKISYDLEPEYGNSSANISGAGIVTEDSDWIYYIDNDAYAIKRIN